MEERKGRAFGMLHSLFLITDHLARITSTTLPLEGQHQKRRTVWVSVRRSIFWSGHFPGIQ